MVVWSRMVAPPYLMGGTCIAASKLPFHKGMSFTARDGSLIRNTGANNPSEAPSW